MKKCSGCGRKKTVSEFNKNKSKSDGLNSICRKCSNKRSRQYYTDNREKHKQIISARNKQIRADSARFLWDYKCTHPCIDCGESNPIVLEFDHTSKNKFKNIC